MNLHREPVPGIEDFYEPGEHRVVRTGIAHKVTAIGFHHRAERLTAPRPIRDQAAVQRMIANFPRLAMRFLSRERLAQNVAKSISTPNHGTQKGNEAKGAFHESALPHRRD